MNMPQPDKPSCVILLHGLLRTQRSMQPLQQALEHIAVKPMDAEHYLDQL